MNHVIARFHNDDPKAYPRTYPSVYVEGAKWRNQCLSYGEIDGQDTLYMFGGASVIAADGLRPEERDRNEGRPFYNVHVGDTLTYLGRTYLILRPGSMDGDNCKLEEDLDGPLFDCVACGDKEREGLKPIAGLALCEPCQNTATAIEKAMEYGTSPSSIRKELYDNGWTNLPMGGQWLARLEALGFTIETVVSGRTNRVEKGERS